MAKFWKNILKSFNLKNLLFDLYVNQAMKILQKGKKKKKKISKQLFLNIILRVYAIMTGKLVFYFFL